jgi:hypothetical protein
MWACEFSFAGFCALLGSVMKDWDGMPVRERFTCDPAHGIGHGCLIAVESLRAKHFIFQAVLTHYIAAVI